MAQVRENVGRMLNNGNSLRTIIREVRANADYTKWDVVKTFLWWCMFKMCDGALWLWPHVPDVMNVILWFLLLIVGGAVTLIVTVATVITSPLWMMFRLWWSPEKMADYLLSNAYGKVKKPDDVPFVFMRNVWNTGAKLLKYLWWPVWSTLSMSKRQYFIDRSAKPLANYSPHIQIDYFREKKSAEVIQEMSGPAVGNLWKLGVVKERCYILRALPLSQKWNEELFMSSDQMFDILKLYCETATRPLSSELISFYIQQMVGDGPGSPSRAFELLKICCEKRVLENTVLLAFVHLLSNEDASEKANELLKLYFERNTFSNEVVEALVVSATEPVIDEARERAYALLLKVVRRDGISTELAENFFDHCDEAQDKDMSKVLKMRCDLDAVSFGYDNEGNRKEWTKYCSLIEELSDEAQVKMVEWQYDIFHESGHKLSVGVIYDLLVKRISKDEVSYFEKVLDEEEGRMTLSATSMKLIMMTPWKRDIIKEKAWAKKGFKAKMWGII